VIRFYLNPIDGLRDLEARSTRKDLRQQAFAFGIEMLDQNEGHAAVGWQCSEQFGDSFEASR
jgi:hypothetical protein